MTTLNYRYPAIQGELEDEFELEDEAFLGALGGIARGLLGEGEAEWEEEAELEWEEEAELEWEGEAEFEGESEWEEETEFEFEFEAEAEAELEAEGELEDEFEAEAEEEAEGFVNPVRRIYRDAERMAYLATRAAQTESEAEAEEFIGALVPLAAKVIPRAARFVLRNSPTLKRHSRRLVRAMRRTPTGRRMVTAFPVVLQRTAQSLADQAAAGRAIDGDVVVRTLGRMAGRVLHGPRGRRAARAVDVFNRRWHRRARWARRHRRHHHRPGTAWTASGYAGRVPALRRGPARPGGRYVGPTPRRGAPRVRRR